MTTTSGTTTTSTETKADADDTLPLGTQIIPVPSADTTVTCAEVQFTTEQEKWLVKPIDFPTDVWPAVRRMRFTDGKIITTTPEETKLNFGKQHYQDLYGMIFKYLTEKKPPDMVPDGTAREPGENAMIRRTLKSFLETMKAFRYNAKENAVVVLDYGVSKAEKAKFWDEETKMVVVKPIKNPMRQIGTLRQYKVIPESKWEEYMDKIWGDVQKNAHRGRDSLFNNLMQNVIGIPRKAVDNYLKNQEFKQIFHRAAMQTSGSPILFVHASSGST